ncbi:hypothetical protein [Aquabacterium sp. A08]|uniref:hypothetical protein n=1 Tax=Aquabacterium sp. A08 TaxID=2718532 RepID=UPI00141EAFD3|nr:hypothetical protein [Aquabacterium sp. A08]NIC43299.1 hypothetical protein [Aquabacterium sp. A08]
MSPPPTPPTDPDTAPGAWRMAEHWPELAQAVTDQAIESVDLMLRGLDLLVQRGRLTQAEYQVLATPAQRLKHCGIHAQQIVRFQSGRVRQSHEKIDLAYVVESVLQERRDDLALMGITVRRKFQPMPVLIDPTLGYSLAQAMLEWCTPLGSHIDLRLDAQGEPARARLWMKVLTDTAPVQSQVFVDNIQWLLLRQIAATDGGLELTREVQPDGVTLTALCKRTLGAPLAADTGAAATTPSTLFKTVTGAYVLVCSASADTRLQALGLVKPLGASADGVASGAQAVAALRDREVHLLVLDEVHPPADVASLQFELAAHHPSLAVLRLVPAGSATLPMAGMAPTTVAIDTLGTALGPAVMFTLSNVI